MAVPSAVRHSVVTTVDSPYMSSPRPIPTRWRSSRSTPQRRQARTGSRSLSVGARHNDSTGEVESPGPTRRPRSLSRTAGSGRSVTPVPVLPSRVLGWTVRSSSGGAVGVPASGSCATVTHLADVGPAGVCRRLDGEGEPALALAGDRVEIEGQRRALPWAQRLGTSSTPLATDSPSTSTAQVAVRSSRSRNHRRLVIAIDRPPTRRRLGRPGPGARRGRAWGCGRGGRGRRCRSCRRWARRRSRRRRPTAPCRRGALARGRGPTTPR